MGLYKGSTLISGSSRVKTLDVTLEEYHQLALDGLLDDDVYYNIINDTDNLVVSVDLTIAEYKALEAAGLIEEEVYYNTIDDFGDAAVQDEIISPYFTWSSEKISNWLTNVLVGYAGQWAPFPEEGG